jgi:acyl-CoA reductase-like NAD-dependent aldehyde dehydrogenase
MLQPMPSLSVQPQRTAKTTRLDVAAFLLVRGFQILQVDLSGNTATFVFEDLDLRADSVVREFYNNGQVSANEYGAAQKRVRDLMWEAKRRAS